MKKIFLICPVLFTICVAPFSALCAEHAVSIGYGLAAFNDERSLGKIEGGRYYDFVQAVYIYERPLSLRGLAFVLEPFAAYVNRPNSGVDAGLDMGLKYYPFRTDKGGFYITAGPGIAYTTTGFKEQGTHLLFILQGGIGYRYHKFFIENRFRHYSNGGTAKPNWSVNADIISIGMYF